MRVLVVSKKTNLELHGETIRKRVQAGLIDPVYFKLLEKTHEEHYTTLHELFRLLDDLLIDYSTIARGLYWPDLSTFSYVITVGGDGTILEASHHILDSRIVLVGVRSAQSSVGKLCHSNLQNLETLVRSLAENTLDPLSVTRLQAQISSIESGQNIITEPVLNDFLYTNATAASTTRYKITLGTTTEEQRSSGTWISTPCGSTAAIFAAGGKAMDLASRHFQYLVRELYDSNPMNREKFLASGEFNPETDLFQIENLSEKAVLAFDGLHGIVNLNFGDVITFIRAADLRLAPPAFYKLP
jgi:NAD+ kinase